MNNEDPKKNHSNKGEGMSYSDFLKMQLLKLHEQKDESLKSMRASFTSVSKSLNIASTSKKLEREYKSKNEELEKAQKNEKELKKKIKKFEKNKEKEIKSLNKIIDDVKQELEKKKIQHKQEIETLKLTNDNEKKPEEENKYKQEIENLNKTINAIKQEFEKKENKYKQEIKALKSTNDNKQKPEEKKSKYKQEIENLNKTINSNKQEFDKKEKQYKQEIEALKQTINNNSKQKTEEKEDKYKQEVEALKSTNNSIKQEFEKKEDKYKQEIEALKSTNNSIKQEFEKKENKYKQDIDTLKSTNDSKQKSEERENKYKQDIEKKQKKIDKLSEKCSELEKQISEKESQHNKDKKSIEDLETLRKEKETEMSKKISLYEEEIESLKKESLKLSILSRANTPLLIDNSQTERAFSLPPSYTNPLKVGSKYHPYLKILGNWDLINEEIVELNKEVLEIEYDDFLDVTKPYKGWTIKDDKKKFNVKSKMKVIGILGSKNALHTFKEQTTVKNSIIFYYNESDDFLVVEANSNKLNGNSGLASSFIDEFVQSISSFSIKVDDLHRIIMNEDIKEKISKIEAKEVNIKDALTKQVKLCLKNTTNAENVKGFNDAQLEMENDKTYFNFGEEKIYAYYKISEDDLKFEGCDDNSFKIKFEIPGDLEVLEKADCKIDEKAIIKFLGKHKKENYQQDTLFSIEYEPDDENVFNDQLQNVQGNNGKFEIKIKGIGKQVTFEFSPEENYIR